MPQPINTRDAAACGAAYTRILGWPIAPGHRHRPNGGCTCGEPDSCPGSGAHPLPGPLTPSPEGKGLADELNASPGAALIAPTVAFDALVLPKWTGLSAVMWLDRHGAAVPCLLQGEDHAVLFVLPATGRYALPEAAHTTVQVRSGPQEWVALPPSHGTRWETPPWHEQTHHPLPLIPGNDLLTPLEQAMRGNAEPHGAHL